jgi:hypothetical protein
VIKSSNSTGKTGRSRMETPKWWFKSRSRDRDAVAPAPAPVAAPMTPRLSELPDSPPVPSRSRDDGGKRSATDMRQWAPYSHHVAMGLAAAAIFGVGFLVGQRVHPASAQTATVISPKGSEEIMAGAVNAGVLEVDGNPLSPVQAEAADPTMGTPAQANATPSPSWNDNHAPSTSIVQERPRIIGYNYVIMQSYPDEKDAQEAVAALADNGIVATVVPGPPGWAANTWYSVVGTTGFDKVRNSPEYDRYVRAAERVSNKYAGKVKFKQFSPRAYKWKTPAPATGGH